MYSMFYKSSAWIFLVGWFLFQPPGTGASQGKILSLKEAQDRALSFSPQLAASGLDLNAAGARRDQAHRRANPELALDWENFAGTGGLAGVGSSELTVSVAQVFDLGGKRGHLADQIADEISLLTWQKKSAMQDLRQEVGLAFAEVWFAQETLALVKEQGRLSVRLQEELVDRLSAGGSSTIEVTRAKVDVARARVLVIRAEERLVAAQRQLTALWGMSEPDFQTVLLPEDFLTFDSLPLADLDTRTNPDVARWNSVRSWQASRLKVAESAASIDLELAVGMKWENVSGDRAFVLGAGFPLPVSNRNQDEIVARKYELQRVSKQELASVTRLETRLAILAAELESARLELDIMSGEIIPLAQQAYEETRIAHVRGLFGLTDVLATRHDLFDLRQNQLVAHLRFIKASVRISRLTGKLNNATTTVDLEDK